MRRKVAAEAAMRSRAECQGADQCFDVRRDNDFDRPPEQPGCAGTARLWTGKASTAHILLGGAIVPCRYTIVKPYIDI